MRTLRASEIGAFLYCKRAWWYQRHGQPSENQSEMAAGSEYHRQHGRQYLQIVFQRWLAAALLMAALILVAVAVTRDLLR